MPISKGLPLQRTGSGKTIHIQANFPHPLLETSSVFVITIGFPLLADNKNWRIATNSIEL
jgi:hypothetical protein